MLIGAAWHGSAPLDLTETYSGVTWGWEHAAALGSELVSALPLSASHQCCACTTTLLLALGTANGTPLGWGATGQGASSSP